MLRENYKPLLFEIKIKSSCEGENSNPYENRLPNLENMKKRSAEEHNLQEEGIQKFKRLNEQGTKCVGGEMQDYEDCSTGSEVEIPRITYLKVPTKRYNFRLTRQRQLLARKPLPLVVKQYVAKKISKTTEEIIIERQEMEIETIQESVVESLIGEKTIQSCEIKEAVPEEDTDDSSSDGYDEEDLADIPPLLSLPSSFSSSSSSNDPPSDHHRVLAEAAANRFQFDEAACPPATLSHYFFLATEEYLRIKLRRLQTISEKSLSGSRNSRNSLKGSGGSSVSVAAQVTAPPPRLMSIYGQYAPLVDGSVLVFRGDLQEVLLDCLVQSNYSIPTAIKSLSKAIGARLTAWSIEEQRNIHIFLCSKQARQFQKLKRFLPKKKLKDILDYISKFSGNAQSLHRKVVVGQLDSQGTDEGHDKQEQSFAMEEPSDDESNEGLDEALPVSRRLRTSTIKQSLQSKRLKKKKTKEEEGPVIHTKYQRFLEKAKESFDNFSSHQFYSTMYIWSLNFLSPAELVVRVIHILAEAVFLDDSLQQRRDRGGGIAPLSSEEWTSYLRRSRRRKREFYEEFSDFLPEEMRENILQLPLFLGDREDDLLSQLTRN